MPKHSTGTPETFETPPAVDDDLLRDIGQAAHYSDKDYLTFEQTGRHLLASEPMRRYVAAQTAHVERRLAWARDRRDLAKRERDEARAELDKLHSWDGMISLLNEHWPADVFGDGTSLNIASDTGVQIVNLVRALDTAKSEVECLRAASPTLPDVGPVTRDGDTFIVDGERYGATGHPAGFWRERGHVALREAALRYAVADAEDREVVERSASTTTDDALDADEVNVAERIYAEQRAVATILDDYQDLEWTVQARLAIAALDAHRARQTGEA